MERAGWVEHSETHQTFAASVGFAPLNPPHGCP
jgi:hypothetical protein